MIQFIQTLGVIKSSLIVVVILNIGLLGFLIKRLFSIIKDEKFYRSRCRDNNNRLSSHNKNTWIGRAFNLGKFLLFKSNLVTSAISTTVSIGRFFIGRNKKEELARSRRRLNETLAEYDLIKTWIIVVVSVSFFAIVLFILL